MTEGVGTDYYAYAHNDGKGVWRIYGFEKFSHLLVNVLSVFILGFYIHECLNVLFYPA
jgi:hypothetical protein